MERKSLKYKICSAQGGVEVRFLQFRRRQIIYSLIWSAACIFILSAILSYRNLWRLWPVLGLLSLALLGLGLFAAVNAASNRTIFLSRDQLDLRYSLLGIGFTRSFRLEQIKDFGFGNYGHNGRPVLKFEVGDNWVVLVTGITPDEADDIVAAIEARGIRVPR